jgi:hypothetical protein
MHPLVSWWATLWTLSMLARYEPGHWVASLNVDTNQRAVPLETILDAALSIVPQLISEAFTKLIIEHEHSDRNGSPLHQ